MGTHTRVRPKCILVRGRQREMLHSWMRRWCNHGGRDWSHQTTSQGMLAATGSYKRHERESPPEPLRGAQSYDTLILDFWPPKL